MRSRKVSALPGWNDSAQLTTAASYFFLPSRKESIVGNLQKKIAAAVMIVVATHYIKKWAQS